MAASHCTKNVLRTQNYVKVSGMDFKEFLGKNARVIEKRLLEIIDESKVKFGETNKRLGELFSAFGESADGGKRIRGVLVLAGYEIAGGKNPEKIVDSAVAYEIFQTAILAQDDVIDKSLTRRGRPSLYSALGGDHRAISQTICLSDLGMFLSFRLISALQIQDANKNKAINFFSQTLMQTVLGEMLDIELSNSLIEEKDALKIGLLKTARYTVSGPLILGAILGGADLKIVKKLQGFGDNLGIGFQIQDDILGIFGAEEIIGKSAISDIQEGKGTVISSYAFKNATSAQVKFLDKNYGDEKISLDNAKKVRQIFEESGALKYSEALALKYFEEARGALKDNNKGLLYSLVDYIEKRQK